MLLNVTRYYTLSVLGHVRVVQKASALCYEAYY